LVVQVTDKVMAIRVSGQITRSSIGEVPITGRDTMGVKFVAVKDDDRVKTIALNPEADDEEASEAAANAPQLPTEQPELH